MTNKEIVERTSQLLTTNVSWKSIYERYANQIIKNEANYKANKKKFQVKKPLTAYSTIGKVKSDSKTCLYDLRFAGQSVGTISVKNDNVEFTVSDKEANYSKNKLNFEDSKAFKKVAWKTDKDAQSFRRFFYGLENSNTLKVKSQEHRLENLFLQEFSKKLRAQNKLLCNIQPVRLGDLFFQLTTPLKASSHQPTISLTKSENGANGGGIDILARTGNATNDVRLTIFELKDDNNPSEPQKDVMLQAMTYATFIAHLLRSESGKKWWKIFGFSVKGAMEGPIDISQHIDLNVVSLMPSGDTQEGELTTIELPELNISLHPFTLYFDIDSKGNPCALNGTFPKELKK
ncbi:MAG: hypothetical protein IK117_10095 [Bacteroidales bacterium]|nr:hypothetical protein [Bacteroidales bacterium]